MPISPYHFSVMRMILGFYLTLHFSHLIFWAPELFSRVGVVNDHSLNPTSKIFPNLLYIFDQPIFTQFFLIFLVLISLLFTLGVKRNWMALILWYGWACLFNRNILIGNPGMPFIGLLLLFIAIIPKGEPWAREKTNSQFKFPKEIHTALWLLLALGYTVSGLHKVGAPSWINGMALQYILENPLARDTVLRDILLQVPILLMISTWLALGLEILYLPLSLFKRLRPFVWLSMVGMHIGILLTIDFADLTIGVLMIHLFTFDSRWLLPAKREEKPIIFFDGVCGLCGSFVDFLFSEDQRHIYNVATLQGATAQRLLRQERIDKLETLVILDRGCQLVKSEAVLSVFQNIGGFWKIFSLLKFVPLGIRDKIYDLVASNRYSIFGKKETCRVPTQNERVRFLDF